MHQLFFLSSVEGEILNLFSSRYILESANLNFVFLFIHLFFTVLLIQGFLLNLFLGILSVLLLM